MEQCCSKFEIKIHLKNQNEIVLKWKLGNRSALLNITGPLQVENYTAHYLSISKYGIVFSNMNIWDKRNTEYRNQALAMADSHMKRNFACTGSKCVHKIIWYSPLKNKFTKISLIWTSSPSFVIVNYYHAGFQP